MERKIVYRISHVGINNQSAEEAAEVLKQLCFLFDLEPAKDNPGRVFAGDLFEVMKHTRRGKYGHISLQTEDVEAAMADLAAKGITFQEDTIKRDENGKINFVYFVQEIGGFAFHLTT